LRDAAATTLGALKPKTQWRCSLFPLKPNWREPLSKDKEQNAEEISSFQAGGGDKYQ